MKLNQMLMGASALIVGATGMAGAGNATGTSVYGLGSSLVAPYARQEFDCYGSDANLYFQASPSTNPPIVQNPSPYVNTSAGTQCTSLNPITGSGAPTEIAPVDSTSQLNYESTGSGTGIKGLVAHDATKAGALPAAWPSAPLGVQYGFAETSLDATDVGIYNNGNVTGGTCGNQEHIGLCVVAPGVTPGSGQVANPAALYGALVQFPMLITPVAIAYDPVYEKVYNSGSGTTTAYKFRLHYPRADGSGGLRLDVAAFCKIVNGQIQNWNDPALTALNGGTSLEDVSDPTPAGAWSVPLQIVGRSDSSGTTSLFTRHAAAVCGSVTYTAPFQNNYTSVTTTLPAALIGGTYTKGSGSNAPAPGETLGKFTVASGSDGVAEYVGFTRPVNGTTATLIQGRVGYVGPDYALPAVTTTKATASVLQTASLQNHAGKYIAPTAGGALAAFAAQLPPQSTSTGLYSASTTANGLRTNPQDWVQGTTTTSYLADPVPATAYPITGTSNGLYYSCYSSAAKVTTMTGFLKWYLTNTTTTSKTGVLGLAGFSPLPTAWRRAIQQTFVNPTGATRSLNLFIGQAGNASAPQCTGSSIVGG
jgi:ABC-type phosphate transport system substrate-binding protein